MKRLCGPTDCHEVTDREAFRSFHEGGAATDPPAKAAAFYPGEIAVQGDGGRPIPFALTVVPDAGLVRSEDGTWVPVSPAAVAQFRRLGRGLDPFPATRLGGLKTPAPAEAQVDQAVAAPPGAAAGQSADAARWPWIAGGLVVVTALGLLCVTRRPV